MQAKATPRVIYNQSLKTSLFCTRVVCFDCKVSLQSSSRVILFLIRTPAGNDVRRGSWVGEKITMSGKEGTNADLDLNTLRMCRWGTPDGERC